MRKEEKEEILNWAVERDRQTKGAYYVGDDGRTVSDPREITRKAPISPEAWGRSVGTLVKQFVGAEIAKLEHRLAQIERREVDLVDPLEALAARIEALEAREQRSLADAFQGPWLPQRTYKRGALVQRDGSAWIALADTSEKPGQGEGWRLLVKGAGR